MIASLADGQKAIIDTEKNRAIVGVATQVAHDIRSPLSALDMMLSSLGHLDEERRSIVRNAVQRINDIENDLLSKNKQIAATNESLATAGQITNTSGKHVVLLSSCVDMIVSEKRTQYRTRTNLRIETSFNDAHNTFVSANSIELGRVISNLINNAVEATHRNQGQILVGVRDYKEHALIQIIDNGIGMPKDILAKLGTEAVSFGKENTSSGAGLGILHAKKVIDGWGGKLVIKSTFEVGTIVEIYLPKSLPPPWFPLQIAVHINDVVVSVDDDITINQIWKSRFSAQAELQHIEFYHFTSAHNFTEWLSERKDTIRAKFLIDYEFLNQNIDGLELIEKNGIQENSILVTNRFEDLSVKSRAAAMAIKIPPKNLAPYIPIVITYK